MTRTLRGAWSRRWTLLPLLLLTVVVVSGTVAVVVLAGSAGTSLGLAVPLLVLGLVAVPATARELAEARRAELGLARLRGVQGGRLSALAALEPLLVLLLGGALGLLLGEVVGRVLGRVLGGRLGPGAGSTTTPLLAPGVGLAVVVVGLVAVVAGMSRTLGEPLADQVRAGRRPRAGGPWALAGSVLVVVAAVVATYRASGYGPDGDAPDVLVLAAPALVGLAVGQAVATLLPLVARASLAATRRRGLGGFLAVRRLARVADVVAPLRLVVAAGTVATLAATGAVQVTAWAGETARLRTGGPERVVLADGDAGQALRATEQLDPNGKHLMAAVLVPGTGDVSARRAYLDLGRYPAVLGDFYAGTAVAGAEPSMHDLVQPRALSTGATLEVGVRGVSARSTGRVDPVVSVSYLDPTGTTATADVVLALPLDGSQVAGRAPLPGCDEGCSITQVTAARPAGDSTLPWLIDRIDFGGSDVLGLDWTATQDDDGPGTPGGLLRVDGGLLARSSARDLSAVPEAGPLPVIATDTVSWDGPPQVDSPGGDDRPATLVARSAALPLVEADGVLADLPTALLGSAPTVPIAEVSVVVGAGTPAPLVRSLERQLGARAQLLDGVERTTARTTGATQAGVYAAIAAACLLIALLALVTALGRQRAGWRHDVAALRAVGLPGPVLREAARREQLLLALGAASGTAIGGLLACRLLLAHLALVRVPDHSVPLLTAVSVPLLLGGAVAAAAVVVAVVGWGRSAAPARTRPSILREGAGR